MQYSDGGGSGGVQRALYKEQQTNTELVCLLQVEVMQVLQLPQSMPCF